MKKSILLVFGILALALVLSGCSQQPPAETDSGLESDSTSLDTSINDSEGALNDSGNGLDDIASVELPADAAAASGLEADSTQFSTDATGLDSLVTALSDFTEIDSLDSVNPADLQ